MEFKFVPLHCCWSVSNMKETLEWMDRILGFKLAHEMQVGKSHIAMVVKDGYEFEIVHHEDWKPNPEERRSTSEDLKTCGNKHICLKVKDYEEFTQLMEHFKANDVKFAMEPVNIQGVNAAYILGPDDILLEFTDREVFSLS